MEGKAYKKGIREAAKFLKCLSFMYPIIKAIEYILSPLNNLLGMFQTIELEKTTTE